MWGMKMQVFLLLKVLAVGQTSIVACMLLCGQRLQTEERRLSALMSQIQQCRYVLQACKKYITFVLNTNVN